MINKQPNTYMYLYVHIFKNIALKGFPLDQSSCNTFSELTFERELFKTIFNSDWKRESINI